MAIESAELPAATTTAQGAVELATTAETQAGVDTTRAVVASGLVVRKIGTAFLMGDMLGNVRGGYSIDIRGYGAAAEVASGEQTLAIGWRNTASGNYSTASGYTNVASGIKSTAVGALNTASGLDATAIGYTNTASGARASAMGYAAEARIDKTTNICGPQIIRKDDGEGSSIVFESFCGVEVILMSKEVDLKTVADQTITLPAGCKFWLNEIGLIATSIVTLTVQPTIRFGITGNLAKHNAAAITTAITATGKREIETPLVPADGETSLTAGVTVAATATTALGRFYWKGMLVEDE